MCPQAAPSYTIYSYRSLQLLYFVNFSYLIFRTWLIRVLGEPGSSLHLHFFCEDFNGQPHDCCAYCCACYGPINPSREQNGACCLFSSLVLCNITRHILYMCPPTFFLFILIPHTLSANCPNPNLFYHHPRTIRKIRTVNLPLHTLTLWRVHGRQIESKHI